MTNSLNTRTSPGALADGQTHAPRVDLGSKRVVGLDIIRSVAILSVMASHFLSTTYHKYPQLLGLCGTLGVFGVEIFFVLSGYLIGGIFIRDLEGGHFGFPTVTHFWRRRWFRTLPNYYLFLAIDAVLAVLDHKSISSLPKYLFFCQNIIRIDPKAIYQISWSLCLEEWAYLLLPICCLGFVKLVKSKKIAIRSVILLLVLLPLALRILDLGNLSDWDGSVRKAVAFHIDGIFFGVGLAFLSRYHADLYNRVSRKSSFFLGIVAVVVLAAWLTEKFAHAGPDGIELSNFANLFYLNIVDLSMIPIVAFCASVNNINESAKRFFVAISTYSYALYLCHILAFPIGGFVFNLFFKVNKMTNLLLTAMYFFFSFAIAIPVYHLYEKRITRLRERRSPTVGGSLAAAK